MSENTGHIDDGYDIPGYIAAPTPDLGGRSLWKPLEFTYRAATRPEWLRLDAKVAQIERNRLNDPECAVKAEQEACDFAAKHLRSWNFQDRMGTVLPMDGKSVMQMHANLFLRLYLIIRGDQLSDPLPNGDVPKTDGELAGN